MLFLALWIRSSTAVLLRMRSDARHFEAHTLACVVEHGQVSGHVLWMHGKVAVTQVALEVTAKLAEGVSVGMLEHVFSPK